MKRVAIKELKEHLSDYTKEAAHGTPIQVTKYNKPYVCISAIQTPFYVHIGKNVGKASLQPIKGANTKGAFLRYLLEDREA